jgi:hypothetical protein
VKHRRYAADDFESDDNCENEYVRAEQGLIHVLSDIPFAPPGGVRFASLCGHPLSKSDSVEDLTNGATNAIDV